MHGSGGKINVAATKHQNKQRSEKALMAISAAYQNVWRSVANSQQRKTKAWREMAAASAAGASGNGIFGNISRKRGAIEAWRRRRSENGEQHGVSMAASKSALASGKRAWREKKHLLAEKWRRKQLA